MNDQERNRLSVAEDNALRAAGRVEQLLVRITALEGQIGLLWPVLTKLTALGETLSTLGGQLAQRIEAVAAAGR